MKNIKGKLIGVSFSHIVQHYNNNFTDKTLEDMIVFVNMHIWSGRSPAKIIERELEERNEVN